MDHAAGAEDAEVAAVNLSSIPRMCIKDSGHACPSLLLATKNAKC